MPIYEYLCIGCSLPFELIHLGSEKAEPICPHCDSTDAKKQITSPGLYSIGGDNSASTPPKSRATQETNRRMAKRERVDGICKLQGADLGYDKG